MKISTENLNKINASVGIVAGGLSIALAVWQIVNAIEALKAQKKFVPSEKATK